VGTTTEQPTAVGGPRIAVVIPCYKVRASIDRVLARIGPTVHAVYCVDDACPDGSGQHVEETCQDPRVVVLRNEVNLGVGGATLTGFQRAFADGATVAVKIDGDGQMDPALIDQFVAPIVAGRADYTKGNRFFHPSSVKSMPLKRVLGNGALSFLTKLSTGYWDIFDPTNGYLAIHAQVFAQIKVDDLSERYFFESDLLYHLGILGAVVEDIPMDAVYGDEQSHLRIGRAIPEFLFKNLRNASRRLTYDYYLRSFSLASLELPLGLLLLTFGSVFGVERWLESLNSGTAVTAGTVMVAALPVILGMQFLLSFLAADMRQVPRPPLQQRMSQREPPA